MGFVATPALGRAAVALGATALARLAHRGGLDADGKSGDGAGLLIQVPERLVGTRRAVVVLFAGDQRARETVEQAMASHGMRVAEWRQVPVDVETLGARARETMPQGWHGLIDDPGLGPTAWERRPFRERRSAEKQADAHGLRMYIPSCSSRTVVYKGLMAGTPPPHLYLRPPDTA